MAIRDQQIDAMPATTCAQKSPQLEVRIVVYDAGTQFLGNTINGEV